ncbi:alkylated DNA repair protein alkB homolog 8 isoform X2 [Macrosteles quadrilineatus]|uniref:alkylated DNA repair protein alkB homolog 8 isoform X2 n=1 Tax=Macrosteles quadrilineatus TaxID=74068 RepID=UPI0023E28DE2|nr:alkylated DNA repair protein alkB homolog 8 isoform X2 [Macrosteles quadrilineatus]
MPSFKIRRRQSKYKQVLKNDFDIEYSNEPTKNIMIGNAGLVSGIKYEQLAQLLTEYGKVDSLVMIPGKSYSFVVYSTVNEATEAFDSINGILKLDNMDGPLFLVYTSSGKSLKNRRVKHYGYEFRYDNNNVDKDSPLDEAVPDECGFIVDRLQNLGYPLTWVPDQLTVNQYQKGQGIPSHIDTHSAFESPLLSLSLGSDVVMEFRRGNLYVPIMLPRRSILIMDGDARYAWTHGITPRTMDVVRVEGGLSVRERGVRTSFTLRRVRRGQCNCDFPLTCDSQQVTISDTQASQLEAEYVHEVYNNIADHFSETRTKVWPNVKQFLMLFDAGSVIVDAGCGNGKYFGVNRAVYQVGFDRSEGLAGITHSRGFEVFVSDCLSLPLRDNVADGIISVAVVHHLSTAARREQALREMSRVLMPGGRALVTVWAKDQTKQSKTAYLKQDRKNRRGCDRSEKISQAREVAENRIHQCEKSVKESTSEKPLEFYTSVDSPNITNNDFKLPIHTARTEFQHQDVFVPWKVKSKNAEEKKEAVFLRYYHVFEENELVKLCNKIEGINVLDSYYTEGNWCVIFQKDEK